MFCKWCGGNLNPSDHKCRRCGREVPALSDCGGFYDLVPNVVKSVEVQPVPIAPPKRKHDVKKTLYGLITLSVALVLSIAVLVLVIALGKTSESVSNAEVSISEEVNN